MDRRDVALGSVLGVLGVAETTANSSLAGHRVQTLVPVLLLCAAVALRRRSPEVAAATAGAVLALSAVLGGHGHDESFVVVVGELVLAFTVASRQELVPALRGGAALLGGLLLAIAVSGDVSDALLGGIVLAAPWAAGRVVHRLHAQTAALAAVSAELAAERDRAASDAVLAERARIARDLHDVVAHHVSVMVVQAGGARGVLHDDPAAAEQALQTVERTGRAALVEMRRLLGVLRNDDPRREPQPRLQDAAQLLDAADEWEVVGEPVALDPGLDLTGYRLVQEALTNARRHGRGPASVQLSWSAERLEIVVDNAGARGTASPGHGVRGMTERATLYGGTLAAGPHGADSWRVHAVLPLTPVSVDA